ncbi:hypothetical protein FRB99_002250 [Tulasnella sp. 403]|nr:hypothetical protein FRB99_002250 [Tulasnella sp. 403]
MRLRETAWLKVAFCVAALLGIVSAGPHQVAVTDSSVGLSTGWTVDGYLCGNSWKSAYTIILGSSANFTFVGKGIDIYGQFYKSGGISTILLDGHPVAGFDSTPPLKAPCQAHIYSVSGLPVQQHTVAIYLTAYGPDSMGLLELSHFVYDDPNMPDPIIPTTTLGVISVLALPTASRPDSYTSGSEHRAHHKLISLFVLWSLLLAFAAI